MALDNMALAKASAKLIDDYKSDLAFVPMCNRDFEGDVKFNGSVKIYQAGQPTPATFTRDSTTIAYERLNPGEQIMTVTRRSYFGLKADDLEAQLAFAKGALWQRTIRNGAYALAKEVDTYISGTIMTNAVPTANVLAARSLGLGMAGNALDLLFDLAATLRQNDVPMVDCHVCVPPKFLGLLKKDERFSGYNTPAAAGIIRGSTVIAVIDNLQVHVSTNSPVSGTGTAAIYTIIAGSTDATTYAEQLSKMENLPRQAGDFDDRVRSQLVYDAKVIVPQALAKCAVTFA